MKLGMIVLVLGMTCAHAAPIAVGEADGIRITLTDEPCQLDAVTNLPRRAIWEEGNKRFEGCWGAMQGFIASYFSDRSVAVIPAQLFVRVREL